MASLAQRQRLEVMQTSQLIAFFLEERPRELRLTENFILVSFRRQK